MDSYNRDTHSCTKNEKNNLINNENTILVNSECLTCNKISSTVRHTQTGNLFNIEDKHWSDRDVILPNALFLTNNGAESRLSLNSGDSVDAPLLLNELYNEFESTDEFHCHSSTVQTPDNKALKKLVSASCMCLFFMVTEIIGGYLANSLSVMTDAAHLLSDFIGFLVSVFSIWLGQRPSTKRHSWGFHRAEVLGALFSIVFIWLLTAIFMYLAIFRLIHGTYDIDANTMICVSAVGVFINIVMGSILHGSGCCNYKHNIGKKHSHKNHEDSHSNINVRAAVIHVLGDFIQSFGVLVAAVIIKIYPEAKIADPICTFIFSIIVIFTTKNIMRDTLNILMESVPLSIDYSFVTEALRSIDGVRHIHNLHIWSLTTDKNALTVHLAVDKFCDKEEILHYATKILQNKFAISSTTIQIEKYKEDIMGNCLQCTLPKD